MLVLNDSSAYAHYIAYAHIIANAHMTTYGQSHSRLWADSPKAAGSRAGVEDAPEIFDEL